VLHRLNGSAVEASRERYAGESGSPLASCVMMLTKEKVRLCRSSGDGWDPKKIASWRSNLLKSKLRS
jgi:hypothetical protein